MERRSRRSGAAQPLWLLLGGWIGSWACFGLVVAPIAFAKLPSTEVAGHLIGPVLSALHRYGAVAGGALALLAGLLGRGRLLVALPLLLAAACVDSQFGVSAEMAEIRDQVFGPQGSEALATRWATSTAGRSASSWRCPPQRGLVVLHARSDARGAG